MRNRKSEQEWKQRLRISVFMYSFILLVAVVVTGFLMMAQYKLKIDVTRDWIIQNPAHFLFSLLFIYMVFLGFFALFGYYYGTVMGTVFICLLGVVHYYKLMIRAEPLFPNDYTQISLLKNVLPMVFNKTIIISIVVFTILIGALIYMRRFLPKWRLHILHRVLLLVFSIYGVYAYVNYTETFMSKVFAKEDIRFIPWFQVENYEKNGTVLGFISNAMVDIFPKPDNYTKTTMMELAEELTERYDATNVGTEEKPNIVYVMSEAFFDPTRMEGIQFSTDPLEKLRYYMKEYSSGYALSPVYGGSTASVEFEALTGFSMKFLKSYAIPYQQVVDKQKHIPTIVSILENEQYETMAMHPYLRTFFKRNRVYDTFGFDTFIARDEMLHQGKASEFIGDQSVVEEILYYLKKKDTPMFIHSVTMQNHYPFKVGKYGRSVVKVSGIEGDEQLELETYAQGLKISSESMKDLFQRLELFDEPTIVVFWGDHLPALGDNQSLFKHAGFIEEGTTPEEMRRMSETPLLFYANFDLEHKNIGTISPSYIAPTLFEMVGLQMPIYYQFLEEVKSQIPAMKNGVTIGSDNEIFTAFTKEQQQLLKEYQLIEYDLLIGKQYTKDILFETNYK